MLETQYRSREYARSRVKKKVLGLSDTEPRCTISITSGISSIASCFSILLFVQHVNSVHYVEHSNIYPSNRNQSNPLLIDFFCIHSVVHKMRKFSAMQKLQDKKKWRRFCDLGSKDMEPSYESIGTLTRLFDWFILFCSHSMNFLIPSTSITFDCLKKFKHMCLLSLEAIYLSFACDIPCKAVVISSILSFLYSPHLSQSAIASLLCFVSQPN